MLTSRLRRIEMLEQKALLTTLVEPSVGELSRTDNDMDIGRTSLCPVQTGDGQTSLMPIPGGDEQTSDLQGPASNGGDFPQTSIVGGPGPGHTQTSLRPGDTGHDDVQRSLNLGGGGTAADDDQTSIGLIDAATAGLAGGGRSMGDDPTSLGPGPYGDEQTSLMPHTPGEIQTSVLGGPGGAAEEDQTSVGLLGDSGADGDAQTSLSPGSDREVGQTSLSPLGGQGDGQTSFVSDETEGPTLIGRSAG